MAAYPLHAFMDLESRSDTELSRSRTDTTAHKSNAEDVQSTQSPTRDELNATQIGPGVVYNRPEWATRDSNLEDARTVSKAVPTEAATSIHPQIASITRPPILHTRPVSTSWPGGSETLVLPDEVRTPNELEMSRPPSPKLDGAAGVVQRWNDPPMNKWRVLSACLCLVGNGMNDSAPGALLPTIEKHYDINYTVVSTIFISNAVGFILAAFFVHALDSRLGRARTLMLCDATCSAGYILMAVAPPFPAFAIGFFITGWAMATTLALHNVFIANLANSTVLLGWFHGAYGLGGTIAPIIATSLVSHGVLFSRFYFIILAIRLISFASAGWSFYHFERDASITVDHRLLDTELPTLHLKTSTGVTNTASSEHHGAGDLAPPEIRKEPHQLSTSLKNRSTLVGALFIFAYQGAEVSVSGWVISFLISYRNGIPSQVGYVTAGFWAGITLGRFLLSYPASRLGERRFVYFTIVGSIVFQLLIWFVPNVIGDAISVALLGFLLGPIYPAATTVLTRIIPRGIQNTALAFVSSAGSSGGALAPFAVGLLAQAKGTWVLHPICIALFAAMIACWFGLPSERKRRE